MSPHDRHGDGRGQVPQASALALAHYPPPPPKKNRSAFSDMLPTYIEVYFEFKRHSLFSLLRLRSFVARDKIRFHICPDMSA